MIRNLARAASFHAEGEDSLHHLCGFFVNDPFLRIVGILPISVWNVVCQRFAALSLRLVDGADFPARVSGIEFVEPVFDPREIVVDAVGIDGVEIVVDGNEANAVFRESEIDVHSRHRRISEKAAEVLDDSFGIGCAPAELFTEDPPATGEFC